MQTLQINIDSLIADCQKALIEVVPELITYRDKSALKNNELPDALTQKPINVYGLWLRSDPNASWKLMYIGQRSAKKGWSRVAQHLFHTAEQTQSKLDEVREAIASGADVGITFILVQPDSMRLAIEEELIQRNSLSSTDIPWNLKGRA